MNYTEETVLTLVRAVRSGDRSAFSELLSAYRPLILSQVARFSDVCDRDELLQDASLALYRAAFSYRAEAGVTFGVFARVCIGNALVSVCRRARTEAGLFSLEEIRETGAMPMLEADGEDPESRLIAREETADLYRAAKDCLSPYEMAVFIRYVRGYTPRQIAPEVARSEKSVSNAIGRILGKLRARLS